MADTTPLSQTLADPSQACHTQGMATKRKKKATRRTTDPNKLAAQIVETATQRPAKRRRKAPRR